MKICNCKPINIIKRRVVIEFFGMLTQNQFRAGFFMGVRTFCVQIHNNFCWPSFGVEIRNQIFQNIRPWCCLALTWFFNQDSTGVFAWFSTKSLCLQHLPSVAMPVQKFDEWSPSCLIYHCKRCIIEDSEFDQMFYCMWSFMSKTCSYLSRYRCGIFGTGADLLWLFVLWTLHWFKYIWLFNCFVCRTHSWSIVICYYYLVIANKNSMW